MRGVWSERYYYYFFALKSEKVEDRKNQSFEDGSRKRAIGCMMMRRIMGETDDAMSEEAQRQ